jgi:hypothetical protein
MEDQRPQIIKEPGDVPASFVRMLGFAWEQAEMLSMRQRAQARDGAALAERDQRIKELEQRNAKLEGGTMALFAHRHTEIQAALYALAALDGETEQDAELRETRKATVRTLLERLLEDNKADRVNDPSTSKATAPAEAAPEQAAPPITLASRKGA